ncbi:MAG: hypothetical protein IJF07_02455 [Lachnospiraceae bacterium]|nr:hypothetical protein [Lachnospiraceae bacterium]
MTKRKTAITEVLKGVGRGILILIFGALLGTFILTLCYMLPVNETNKQKSIEILEKEGWYPVTPIHSLSYDTYFHSYLPGVMDNATDSIMIYTTTDSNQGNPLIRAMENYNAYQDLKYSYYWHGYVSVLKPLLLVLDYSDIRVLNGMLQVLLVFALAYEICKRRSLEYALLALTSYALLMPLALAVSLQYTAVFYIAYGGSLLLIKKITFWEEKGRYLYLFLVLGMLASYFDLLTYPLLTWGFPMVWWLVMSERKETSLGYLKKVVTSGLCWIVGYGGMWSLKWVLGTLATGSNLFESAVYEVFFRVGVEGDTYGIGERLDAIYHNWKHYEYNIYILLLLGWLVWIIYKSIRNGFQTSSKNAALLLIAFSSIVWYFVLSNHTMGHHIFTYRIYGISILAIGVILIEAVKQRGESSPVSKRNVLIDWVLVLALAAGLTLFAREEISAINGDAPSVVMELPRGEVLQTEFVPTFSRITDMKVAMRAQQAEGTIILSLWKDGEMLYQETIAAKAYVDSTYTTIAVDWKLKQNETYQLQLTAEDCEGTVCVILTEPAYMPMNEFRNVTIAGEAVGGQPIMGITYRTLPVSRKTQFFLLATWMAVGAAGMVTIRSLLRKR